MNRAMSFKFPLILSLIATFLVQDVFAGNKPDKDIDAINKPQVNTDFSWSADRKLQWSDFKGVVSESLGTNIAAVTYCSFGFESTFVSGSDKPKVEVFNLFHVNQSWVKCLDDDEKVLAHEQCHFDICELFTRVLKVRMEQCNVTINDMGDKLNSIYDDVKKEYLAFQEAYESSTHHGLIDEEQQKWEQLVATALSENSNIELSGK